MKKVILSTLAMFPLLANAEPGIGISVEGDSSTVYFPTKLGNGLKIEPSLKYSSLDNGDLQEADSYTFSIGVFKNLYESGKLSYFVGGRVGYSDNEVKQGSTEYSVDGYQVAPTVGFEYFMTNKLSVGGEAALVYGSTNFESDTGSTIGRDASSLNTETNVIVRFYF